MSRKELYEEIKEEKGIGEWKTIDELEEKMHKRAMAYKAEQMEEEVKKNCRRKP